MKSSSNLLHDDISQRQAESLDYILDEEVRAKKKAAQGPQVSIEEARKDSSKYEISTNRETTRLLFISQDITLLNQSNTSLDGYLNLSDVFDEVHIVIMQKGIKLQNPVLRIAHNVWIYVASSSTWLGLIHEAKHVINEQLVFADGFRADLIVARDPLESALVALWASHKYDRVAQVHVLEDFTKVETYKQFSYPRLKQFLFRYCMHRFVSVRTNNNKYTEAIKTRFPKCTDVSTLPRFYNFAELSHTDAKLNIKDKYTQFNFIILYVGKLGYKSLAYQAIDASRNMMRSPRVGLVVMGNGEARAEFQKRADIIGINKQVVFEPKTDDLISYLKSADVLLVPDTDEYSEEIIIKAAAAGIPLVISKTAQREDLFTEHESALFFADNDIMDISNKLSRIINEPGLRSYLVNNARDILEEKLHEDPLQYKLSYRDSVESVLFLDSPENIPNV